MGRFRKYMYEECSKELTSDENYNLAYRKVKKIKRFYSHLMIYLIVNVFIIISNLNGNFIRNRFDGNGLLDWETYSTALFWGLGLLSHGLAVFGRNLFFSENWEQKKIQEIMNKESVSNKWE